MSTPTEQPQPLGEAGTFDYAKAQEQQQMEERIKNLVDSCAFRSVAATVGGFGFGAMFGTFMASINIGMPMEVPGQKPLPGQKSFAERREMTMKETFKDMTKEMGGRAYSTGKNFALVGAIFAGTECAIESHRAKHDIYNSVTAGCLTGGVLGVRSGPVGGVMGCLGFAAFSAVIDTYFGL